MNSNFFYVKSLVLIIVLSYDMCTDRQLSAQTPPKNLGFSNDTIMPDLELQLIPLEQIVSIAIKNSPMVKRDSLAIEAGKYNVILNKRNLYDNVSVFGNLASGSQQLGFSGASAGQSVLNGYRYGLNVNVPLSDFLTKKPRVKQAQAQLEELQYRKEYTEQTLKTQVVEQYYSLIAAQKVLKVKSESIENFRVLYQLAERQFRDGTITIEAYAALSETVVKAESEYEYAKSNFKMMYDQFEYLVGVNLSRLIRK